MAIPSLLVDACSQNSRWRKLNECGPLTVACYPLIKFPRPLFTCCMCVSSILAAGMTKSLSCCHSMRGWWAKIPQCPPILFNCLQYSSSLLKGKLYFPMVCLEQSHSIFTQFLRSHPMFGCMCHLIAAVDGSGQSAMNAQLSFYLALGPVWFLSWMAMPPKRPFNHLPVCSSVFRGISRGQIKEIEKRRWEPSGQSVKHQPMAIGSQTGTSIR